MVVGDKVKFTMPEYIWKMAKERNPKVKRTIEGTVIEINGDLAKVQQENGKVSVLRIVDLEEA